MTASTITQDALQPLLAGRTEITAEQCAEHLGLAPSPYARQAIGRCLASLGWRKFRVRREDGLGYAWQMRPTNALERELRAFIKGRDHFTLDDCCYGLKILPNPGAKREIAQLLTRWRWRRSETLVKGRVEWRRLAP